MAVDLRKGTGLRYKMEEAARLSEIKLEFTNDEWIKETDVVYIYNGILFISKNDVCFSFMATWMKQRALFVVK